VVKSCLELAPGLHMIQLTETQSPISLLKPVTSDTNPKKISPGMRKIISLFEFINTEKMRI
jgi:hypothetical protein